MEKASIPGMNKKEILIARSRDRLYRFSLLDNTLRGALIHAPHLVREMQQNHELGLMETMILGQAYLSALLITSSLKGDERIWLQMDCSGPLKGLSVEANSRGEVRGYLYQPDLHIFSALESFAFRPFIESGTLTVSRFLPQSATPYSGTISMKYADLASDLAYYYASSEQTPTAFHLSVRFSDTGELIGSAGLMIQAMPGAAPNDLDHLTKRLSELPSLGTASTQLSPEEFIKREFHSCRPVMLKEQRAAFFCPCNRQTFLRMMNTLPSQDLESILLEDSFPLESRCRNCNTPYRLERNELEDMLRQKMN